MAYNKNHLFTHNVDWFARVGDCWVYAASRGGLLPSRVDNDKILPGLQGVCSNLPYVYSEEEIEYNDELIETRYQRAISFYEDRLENAIERELLRNEYSLDEFKSHFSEIFVEMARKGFYSFIRLNLEDAFCNEYNIVAYPKNGSPQSMSDIIHNPFNRAFDRNDYDDYLKQIYFPEPNISLGLHSTLDFIF